MEHGTSAPGTPRALSANDPPPVRLTSFVVKVVGLMASLNVTSTWSNVALITWVGVTAVIIRPWESSVRDSGVSMMGRWRFIVASWRKQAEQTAGREA